MWVIARFRFGVESVFTKLHKTAFVHQKANLFNFSSIDEIEKKNHFIEETPRDEFFVEWGFLNCLMSK